MKTFASIILTLTAATAAYSQVADEPFQSTYWFADAVVVGTVVAVHDETFEFEVGEWMRARRCQTPKRIRANRYAIPSCVLPQDYVRLNAGSKYLLLLRKPNDEGTGGNANWLVLLQFDLATSSVCLEAASGLRVTEARPGCPYSIKLPKFLDALRTFDRCFLLYDDPIKGTYPTSAKCSDKAMQVWVGRSALHAELAKAALTAIDSQSPR